jgi:heme/copper-type cytochrome/quinol oxidase subunit 1
MRIHFEDIIWGAIAVLVITGIVAGVLRIQHMNNTTKVIDGCEYIRNYNGHGWNLIHKGNCTNIIHFRK